MEKIVYGIKYLDEDKRLDVVLDSLNKMKNNL